jgi:GDPmannose 4,6-dehydratase
MYGRVLEVPQNEDTSFNAVSPYACSKVFAHAITRTYRFSYNMFASTAISFNHESMRRGKEFVTRKISLGVAKIKLGLVDKISLGNLDSKRDWSHAKDIINGIYLIMQHNEPDDFVLCSGETHSVREFIEEAFKIVNISDWQNYIEIDQQFIRPAEVNLLQGDYSKAKRILNWEPKVSFKELVQEMIESDIKLLEKTL